MELVFNVVIQENMYLSMANQQNTRKMGN